MSLFDDWDKKELAETTEDSVFDQWDAAEGRKEDATFDAWDAEAQDKEDYGFFEKIEQMGREITGGVADIISDFELIHNRNIRDAPAIVEQGQDMRMLGIKDKRELGEYVRQLSTSGLTYEQQLEGAKAKRAELVVRISEKGAEASKKLSASMPKPTHAPEGWFEEATRGMLRFAPVMAVSKIAGPGGFYMTFAAIRGNKYQALKDEGMPDAEAADIATLEALMSAPAEFVGNITQIGTLSKMLKGTGLSKRFTGYLYGLFKMGRAEGFEEWVQHNTGTITENYRKNPEASGKELWENVATDFASWRHQKEGIRSFGLGFTGGVLLGGIGGPKAIRQGLKESKQDRLIKKLLTPEQYKELKDNPTLSVENFLTKKQVAEVEAEPAETAEEQFAGLEEDQLGIDVAQTAEQANAGLSTDQVIELEETIRTESERVEASKIARQEKQKELDRQKEAEVASAQIIVEAEAKAAQEVKTESALNAQREFENNVSFRSGLVRTAGTAIPVMEKSGTDEIKRAVKPIRAAQQAIAVPQDNATKLMTIQNDLRISMTEQTDPRIGAMMQRLDDELEIEVTRIDAKERAEEAAKEAQQAERLRRAPAPKVAEVGVTPRAKPALQLPAAPKPKVPVVKPTEYKAQVPEAAAKAEAAKVAKTKEALAATKLKADIEKTRKTRVAEAKKKIAAHAKLHAPKYSRKQLKSVGFESIAFRHPKTGKVYVGKPGEIHPMILDRLGWPPHSDEHDMGYVDKAGKFYSRVQAIEKFEGLYPESIIMRRRGQLKYSRSELDLKAQETRKKMARGALQEQTKEFDEAMAAEPRLQPHTIRHTQRFFVGKQKIYGPKKAEDRGKEVVKRHPIIGRVTYTEYRDKKGNLVLDTPILPMDKKAREKMMDKLIQENKAHSNWYVEWGAFLDKLNQSRMSKNEIAKRVKILGVLSAGRSPRANQMHYAHVLTQLERGDIVKGGAGTKISAPEASKIMDIWTGKDADVKTLETSIKKYGTKVGSFIHVGLHPYDPKGVVVDRHVARLWGFDVTRTQKKDPIQGYHGAFNVTPAMKKMIDKDTIAAGKRNDMSPSQAQAALWFAARPDLAKVGAYREAAQIEPSKYLSEQEFLSTTEDRIKIVHWQPEVKQAIKPSPLLGRVHRHSKEIQKRKDARTAMTDYIGFSDWYGAGVRKEAIISGKAHVTEVPYGKIYNLAEDKLGFNTAAAARVKNDPNAYPGNTSYRINAIAYLLREAGYMGFSTGRTTGTWFHLFQPARVEPQVKVTVALSDVVDTVQNVPQDITALAEILDSSSRDLQVELAASLKRNHYPLTIEYADPTIARFGDATSGQLENGLALKITGPLSAIRAFVADAVGLRKAQRIVFVMHSQGEPNGYKAGFTINPKKTVKEIELILKANGMIDFNLRKTKAGYHVDQFIEDSDTKTGKNILKAFEQMGTPGTAFSYPVHSEILGDTAWTGKYAKATEGYMETITDYFGEDKGREITEEGIEEGEKYSGLTDIRQGYAPGVIASEQRIRTGRAAAVRRDLRVSEPEGQQTQTSLFPVEEKPKYSREARAYGKEKRAALAAAGLPKPERIRSNVNRATNYKHALKFDGKWPDFDMYQFTPQSGPAKGATFVLPASDLTEAALTAKLNATIRAFKDSPKFDRSASSLSSASKIGTTTMGSVESDIIHRADTSAKLKGIYLKHGRNVTQDWMSPAKMGARLLHKLAQTGVSYSGAKQLLSPLMAQYENTYKKVIGPKYFRIKEEGYGEADAERVRGAFREEEKGRDKEAVRRTIQEFKARKQAAQPSGVLQKALTEGFKQANVAMTGRVKFEVLDKSRDLLNTNEDLYNKIEADKAHGTTNGVYDPTTKTFYIFSENVKSVLAAKRVAWHEMGHLSLEEILSKKTMSPILSQIEDKYADEVARRIELYGYKDTPANRAREAEEILVEKFVANEKVSVVQRLRDMLKKFAYKFGFKPNEITDTDIANMVRAMRDNILRNKQPIGNINPVSTDVPKFKRAEPTYSDAFKKWYKGSKLNRDGKPIMFFHGTASVFPLDTIRISDGVFADFGKGFYFSEDARYASIYASRKSMKGSSLMPVYLAIKNPFVCRMKGRTEPGNVNLQYLYRHGSEATAKLKEKGYDGTIIQYPNGTIMEAVAFDRDQVRSVYDIEPAPAQPKYSRTPAEKKSVSNIGINSKQNKVLDPNDLELSALDLVTQQTVDSLHSLKVLETKEGKDLKTLSGYKSFNLLSNFPTIFSSFLRYGRVKFADNWVKVEAEADGGLFTVWNKLGKTADSFFERLTAKSAQEMLNKGRKNLFGTGPDGEMLNDQREIDNIKASTIIEYRQNKELWDWAEKRLRELNRSVLDFAVSSQIVSQKARDEFEREYYVPFFRLVPDELTGELDTLFPKAGGKRAPGKIYKLEGSAKNIGDPLMNLTNSYAFIMRSGLTNLARVKSLTSAKNLGLLTAVPTISTTKNTIGIRIKGEEKFFNVSDSVVYSSMIEMDSMTNGLFSGTMNKLFKLFIRGPKKLLTFGVTMNPAFRIANFMRDTIHTAFMERTYGNVFMSMKGFMDAYRRTPEFIEYMSTGGAFSGAYHQRDTLRPTMKDVLKERKKIEREAKPAWNPIKWWDIYERIGEAAENANRMRVFSIKRKRGASTFEAAYDAKDLLDFHRSGQNQLLQFFTQSVPFLNARIQGLYKLGRTAKDPQHVVNFWVAASVLTMASMMLHFHNTDDERYRKLTDSERLSYWHFYDVPGLGNVRIPTPFEVGSFFGSLPTAITEWWQGDRTDKEMMAFTKQIAQDVFRMDMPQWIKPFWAQGVNQNMFTKAPIVPGHLEKVEPSLQVKPTTTKAAKLIGGGLERLGANDIVSSPARIDQFVSDTAAFAGYATLQTVDQILAWVRAFPDDPAAPEARVGETYTSMMLGYGRFVRGDEPPRFTRQQKAFYDYKKEFDGILASYNLMHKLRMKKKRKEYHTEYKQEIRAAKYLSKKNRRIQNINAKMTLTIRKKDLNAKQKAIKIDKLLDERQRVFEKAVSRVKSKVEEE